LVWNLTHPLLNKPLSPKTVFTEKGMLIDLRFGFNLTSGRIIWENIGQLHPLGLIRMPGDPSHEAFLASMHEHGGKSRLIAVDPATGYTVSLSMGSRSVISTAISIGPKIIYALNSGLWIVDINNWGSPGGHKQISTSGETVQELTISKDGTIFAMLNGYAGETLFSVYQASDVDQCPMPITPPVHTPSPPVIPPNPPSIVAIVAAILIPTLVVGFLVGFWVHKRRLNKNQDNGLRTLLAF